MLPSLFVKTWWTRRTCFGFCRNKPALVTCRRFGRQDEDDDEMIVALRKVIKRMHYPL